MFPSIPCCPQCLSDIAGRQMGMLVPDKEAATFHSEISRAMLSLITLKPTETHLWEKREVPMTSLSNLLSPVRRHTCHSADGDIGPGTYIQPLPHANRKNWVQRRAAHAHPSTYRAFPFPPFAAPFLPATNEQKKHHCLQECTSIIKPSRATARKVFNEPYFGNKLKCIATPWNSLCCKNLGCTLKFYLKKKTVLITVEETSKLYESIIRKMLSELLSLSCPFGFHYEVFLKWA